MSIDSTFRTTAEEKYAISKANGRSEEEINEDVNAIKEWLKKQPHLPADIDEHFIRMTLYWNKYSLQKSKKKIDMHFSIKNLVPEFYEERDLTTPRYQHHMDSVLYLTLPKLTKEFSRVTIFAHANNNPDNFDFNLHMRYLCAIADFRFVHDICMSDTIILDLGNATISHVLKNNPVTLKKAQTVLEKAYSDRIAAIHYVNLPSYAETLVTMAKSIMKEKIAKRLFVHKDYESLHQMVAPEILPVEYGGTERSTTELHADWKNLLLKNNDWMVQMGAKKSNEKLRLGEPLDADMFGSIHGSFRQLAVD